MKLPKMTTRRWMIASAVVAVDLAGILYGSDRVMVFCVIVTVAAPVLIPLAIIVYRLGPSVAGR
jgi:hypothetical protein